LKLVTVKASIFWGYSVKYPTQTAAQDSIPIPPPTTVLGALASAYARYLKLPEVLKVGKGVYSTAVKLLLDGVVKYATSALVTSVAVKQGDVVRNIILIYQRHKESRYHFAVQAVSKVYAPSSRGQLVLAYVVGDSQAELVSKVAWGITAVGCKEGLISVSEVLVHDVPTNVVKAGTPVDTYFITPSNIARCVRSCMEVELCKLTTESYLSGGLCPKECYLVPLSPGVRDVFGGLMRVETVREALVVDLPVADGLKTKVLIPAEVMR